MKAIFLSLWVLVSLSVEAKTSDCGPESCSEIYMTDIAGAKEFGIKINKITISDPPLTRIDINHDKDIGCEVAAVDLALGGNINGPGPEVIVSYEAISSIDGLTVKNHLLASSRLDLFVSCSSSALNSKWTRNVQRILSISLGK